MSDITRKFNRLGRQLDKLIDEFGAVDVLGMFGERLTVRGEDAHPLDDKGGLWLRQGELVDDLVGRMLDKKMEASERPRPRVRRHMNPIYAEEIAQIDAAIERLAQNDPKSRGARELTPFDNPDKK